MPLTRSFLPAILASLLLVGCGGTADSTPTDALSPLPGGHAGASGSGGAPGQGGAGHGGAGHGGQAPAGHAGSGLAGAGTAGAGQGGAAGFAGTAGLAGAGGVSGGGSGGKAGGSSGGSSGNETGGTAGSGAVGGAGTGGAAVGGAGAGGAAGQAGGAGQGGMAGSPECVVASDCAIAPDPLDPCQLATVCDQGVCLVPIAPDGTVVDNPSPTDCVATVCQGGAPVVVPVDETPPADGDPCTSDVCVEGVAAYSLASNGTACGVNMMCDGAGACIPAKVVQLAAGKDHNCALFSTGLVRCWGDNIYGQLGNLVSYTTNDQTPASTPYVQISGKVTQIAAGGRHTCAMIDTGEVQCWGLNDGKTNSLGYGHSEPTKGVTPASLGFLSVGGSVSQLDGGTHGSTCALLTSGGVRCWGDDLALPSSIPLIPIEEAKQVAIGIGRCALLTSGDVRCWVGVGEVGVLDATNTYLISGPLHLGGKVTQISAGASYMCALTEAGAVRCWGSAASAVLGHPGVDYIPNNEVLAALGDISIGGPVTQIAAGVAHTCAILPPGRVRCWGQNGAGQLGYGHNFTYSYQTPDTAGDVNVGGPVTQLVLGHAHTCALLESGTVRCWGENNAVVGYPDHKTVGDDEDPADAGDVVLVAP